MKSAVSRIRIVVPVILALVLLCAVLPGKQALVRIVQTVEPDSDSLLYHDSMRSAIIVTGKRELGKFYTIGIYALIEKHVEKLSPEDRSKALIICEAADGQHTTAALAEFDPAMAVVPAILLIGEAEATRRDSVDIRDIEGMEGVVNLRQLHRETSKLVRERFRLPNCKLSDAEHKRARSAEMMVLFPADRSSQRWLNDVSRIHLAVMD